MSCWYCRRGQPGGQPEGRDGPADGEIFSQQSHKGASLASSGPIRSYISGIFLEKSEPPNSILFLLY